MKWRSLSESTPGLDTRPLREIFAERKEKIAMYVPPETQAVHARVIAELKQRKLAENSLAVGAKAPDFTLNDHNGKPVSLAELLSKGRLVVCFFRGRWDPFCCGQLEAMNRVLPDDRAGRSVAGGDLSADREAILLHGRPAPAAISLLSDAGNHVTRQFGLVYRVPDEQEAIYRRSFTNLPLINGDESWELPIPATYIIERDATVLYASANEDYTERPEPAEIVERLR